MFCPNCQVFLTEDMLIKKRQKCLVAGGIPVEYVACCPRCREDIGKMYWGEFRPHPRFELEQTPQVAHSEKRRRLFHRHARSKKEPKVCPYCSHDLPEDF